MTSHSNLLNAEANADNVASDLAKLAGLPSLATDLARVDHRTDSTLVNVRELRVQVARLDAATSELTREVRRLRQATPGPVLQTAHRHTTWLLIGFGLVMTTTACLLSLANLVS